MMIIQSGTWHCAYCVARWFDQGHNSIDDVLHVVCCSEDGGQVAGSSSQAAGPSSRARPPSGAGPSFRSGPSQQSVVHAVHAIHSADQTGTVIGQTESNTITTSSVQQDEDTGSWENLEEVDEIE